MISKVRSFSLKVKDFSSGKMVSPPREFWKTCDCCGKAIVQGVVMSNGDHIGNDCFLVVERTPYAIKSDKGIDNFFKIMGAKKCLQDYALMCAA